MWSERNVGQRSAEADIKRSSFKSADHCLNHKYINCKSQKRLCNVNRWPEEKQPNLKVARRITLATFKTNERLKYHMRGKKRRFLTVHSFFCHGRNA